MTIDNISSLTPIQMDLLKEIGNIGSGNAATSLSQMLDKRIGMGTPEIKIADVNEVVQALGGPEQMKVGILIFFDGDINGMMMFLLDQDFAYKSIGYLLGQTFEDFESLDEMALSALTEVSNIMIASYINAIAQMTGLTINISTPSICMDMLGAMINVPAVHFNDVSEKLLFIGESFTMDTHKINSEMLMIPEIDSLNIIMKSLGLQ